jgi:hypothetical protein
MRQANYALTPVRMAEEQEHLIVDLDYFSLDAQLRNFQASREATRGRADAGASYRALRLKRDKALKQLENLGPVVHGIEQPALARSIAAARLRDGLTPWFGFSGNVQCGKALESRQWDSPGCKGKLSTHHLGDSGEIYFGANLAGGPIEGYESNEGNHDPDSPQLWIHVWKYLVPFPAPMVDSILTYEFDIHAQFAVVLTIGPGQLYSRLWTGLMPDMTTPNVLADARTTFPINGVSLTPTTGYVRGTRRIRQTCRVRAGKIPAVHMLATAAVALLEPHADLVLGEHESFMIPRASAPILDGPASFLPGGNGLISFHYEPDPVLHQ